MFFLIFILIFLIIKADEIKNKNISIENKTRIYDEINILKKVEFNELNQIIKKNFPLLMIRLLSGEDDIRKKTAYFEASSVTNFAKECINYKDMCDYGFSIDIYLREKLLVIEIGKESKKLIDDEYKQRMINSIIK